MQDEPKTKEELSAEPSRRVAALEKERVESKRTEQALHESEERLRFALETIHIGAWDLDLLDHTSHRSLEHDRIFGYEQLLPQWTYEMFLEHVLPEDRAMVDARFRQATATQGDWSFECRIRRVDGEVRWIWAAGRHRANAAGQIRCLAGIVQDITERKQAEKALHDSEQKYRELVQNANSAIIRWRSDGTITFFNEYAQSFFGYREEEAIGRHVGMLVPQKESYGADLSTLVQDIVRHPELYVQTINENICRDGNRVWMAWTNKPIVGVSGDVSEILAVGTDITERKRAEEQLARAHDEMERRVQERTAELARTLSALAESEARFSEVMENSLDGVHRRNLLTDRYDYLSPAIATLCGYTLEEMFSMSIADVLSLIHPDDLAEVKRHVEECLTSDRRQYTLEYRFRHKDGSYRWFSDFITIVEDPQGRPVYRVGSVRDITERRRMEQALRESEERFRLITETIQDVFWMSTPGVGRMLYVSPAYERIWGRTRESLYAQPQSFMDAVHPEDRTRVFSQLAEHAKGSWECQYRIIQPDGNVRWIDDRGFPIRDEKGNLRFMTGVAIDITGQKRVEEELVLIMKKLQESNQALQDFASIASHDMQEPLRKVTSFGNLLQERFGNSMGDQGKDYLGRMLDATKRMQALLKSLLDYSRVTSMAEPFSRLELFPLIQEVISDLEVRIEKTGGRVELGELPVIEADASQMRQLFQNLIANGLKFHKKGEAALVRVHSAPAGAETVEIVVEDSGIGFDEAKVDCIFAPFQRLHGRDSQYEGTGMGLAICRKIVERHRGTITARSTPGEGSTFLIHLPIKQRVTREGS
jgi:PAS domain S-box-containing protein